MNRQQEYEALMEELKQLPYELDGTALRAKQRRVKVLRRRWCGAVGGVACLFGSFILAVNALPSFALACGHVPILRQIAAAVALSPSLSAAVSHDYVQYVGQSQTQDGVRVDLEAVIADGQQMVVFYQVEGAQEGSPVTCQLQGEDGRPLGSYAVTTSWQENDLRRLEIYFVDLEVPEALEVELRVEEKSFLFSVQLDPEKTPPARVLPVEQCVELGGQRLLVEELRVTPTCTVLQLQPDENNTADLQGLTFYFTDALGNRYQSIDGSLVGTGQGEEDGIYTYYFQSLYQVEDLEACTLWVEEAVWLDRDSPEVRVDLSQGTVTGELPQGVTGVTVAENLGGVLELRVTSTCGRLPFEMDYIGADGQTHAFSGVSVTDQAPYSYTYILKDGGETWVALAPAYTWVYTPEEAWAILLE